MGGMNDRIRSWLGGDDEFMGWLLGWLLGAWLAENGLRNCPQ